MKNRKEIFASAAVILFSALLLNACGEASDGGKTAQTDDAQTGAVTEAVTEKADLVAEAFSGYDYGGYEFRILAMSPGQHFYKKIGPEANEVYYEYDSGDILDSALYQRNVLTEDLLNIKILPVWGGNNNEINPFASKAILAGDDAFDCMLAALAYNMTLAGDGQLVDFHTIESLHIDNPWWDHEIAENFSIYNKLYVLTGHYNIFDDYAVPVIFYNKKVSGDLDLEDPYEVAKRGEWTLEYMMRNAALATADLDGDGKMTIDDKWGYLDNSGAVIHMQGGMDFTFVEKDENGAFQLTMGSDYVVSAVECIYNNLVMSDSVYMGLNADCVTCFSADRGMYYYELLGCINEFRNMESDFGVAPLPKYDVSQKRYTGTINNIWCTALSVPTTQKDLDRTGIILDVLGGYSTDTVHTVLYELVLGEKLVRNPESVEMINLVFNSKTYDLANGFSWASGIDPLFSGMTKKSGFQYVSKYEKAKKGIRSKLDKFLESFAD